MKANNMIRIVLLSLLSSGVGALAQNPSLPTAPTVQLPRPVLAQAVPTAPPTASAAPTGVPTLLTRQDAEKIALANNPHVHISQLIAEVQHQAVRERRADELPTLSGAVTAVEANDGAGYRSGSLTASRMLTHAGFGSGKSTNHGFWAHVKPRRIGEAAGEGPAGRR